MRHQPKTLTLKMPRLLASLALAASLPFACSTEPPSDTAQTSRMQAATDTVQLIDPPSGPGAMAPNLVAGLGNVLLTWLEPASSGQGHALYLAEFQEEQQQWAPARQIATGDAFFANWADLPAATETADGTRFAHWLQKLGDDTYAYGATLARSQDGGETWEDLGLLHDDDSPTEHGFVSYTPLPSGGVQAFWLDGRAHAGRRQYAVAYGSSRRCRAQAQSKHNPRREGV